jgi:hypothetical protein
MILDLSVRGGEMAAVMTVIRNSFMPPGVSLEFKGRKDFGVGGV